MDFTKKLEYGYTYHIFNRGINGTDLFLCKKDYEHFLELYNRFIYPIAETYSWVLLKNHFHILVRIKDEGDMPLLYGTFDTDRSSTLSGLRHGNDLSDCGAAASVELNNVELLKKANPSRQFSHLFNGYARYFNIKTGRHGGLFETPFKRVRVDSEKYFRRLVYYIHHNPIKHGFAEHLIDWDWSSYLSIISVKPTRLSRQTVLGYFDDATNFKMYHQQQHDLSEIECMLLE